MFKRLSFLLFFTLATSASFTASAADLSITVSNLTRGMYFTPLMIAAHAPEDRVFTTGTPASASLQAMAEGGDISGLSGDLTAVGATISENAAGGLLAPGANATAEINTDGSEANTHLTVVAMMLPTNDGFIGLNGIEIPTEPGTYVFNVNAYDSGTEANDEIRGGGASGVPGFPAPGPVDAASGVNGSGVSTTIESFVHIHRNGIGDTDALGGSSDLDATVHRWLNPVARVFVTVN